MTALADSSDPSVFDAQETRPRVSHHGDRTIIWLDGEHDIATEKVLADTLAKAIAVDHADIVIDLSEVEFMSAATLGVLFRGRAFLELRSRKLTLRSPSKCARRIIDLCGLTDLTDPDASSRIRPIGV